MVQSNPVVQIMVFPSQSQHLRCMCAEVHEVDETSSFDLVATVHVQRGSMWVVHGWAGTLKSDSQCNIAQMSRLSKKKSE